MTHTPICPTCGKQRPYLRRDGECENCHRWGRYHTDENYRIHILETNRTNYHRRKGRTNEQRSH